MQQFFNNKYVQLAGLTIALSLLIFIVLWFLTNTLGMSNFPQPLIAMFSVLGAGLIVYKFFANRIF